MVPDRAWYPPATTPSVGHQLAEPTAPQSAGGSGAGPRGVGLAPQNFFGSQGGCWLLIRLIRILSNPLTSFGRHGDQSKDLFIRKVVASHKRRQTDVAFFYEQEECVVLSMVKIASAAERVIDTRDLYVVRPR